MDGVHYKTKTSKIQIICDVKASVNQAYIVSIELTDANLMYEKEKLWYIIVLISVAN